MNIRVLIVEDDVEFSDSLRLVIDSCCSDVSYNIVGDKNSAINSIDSNVYDLIIVDLNIPTGVGLADCSPDHGYAVMSYARNVAFGTPILVLTGSSAEKFIPELLKFSEQEDIWRSGARFQMVTFTPKHVFDQFPDVISPYLSSLSSLLTIELSRNAVEIDEEQERLVRIFANRCQGARVALALVSGGLSGSIVLRLTLTSTCGELICNVICKIGSSETVEREFRNYEYHISRLLPEATPRLYDIIRCGAKATCGILYGLASGFASNVFRHYSDSIGIASLIGKIEGRMSPWVTAVESPVLISKIRSRLLSDSKYSDVAADAPPWAIDFERKTIQVRWGCAHGDLHGLNVLVSENGDPILIDYGDVGDGPSVIDPVTLELSLFFHPDGPLKNSEWPTIEQAKQWWNERIYLDNCPCSEYIKACRAWAKRVSAGDREIAAVAYSYLLRQLRYEGINKERVLALLDGAKNCYDQT